MHLTTTDIRRIMYRTLQVFGMEVCYGEDLPEGELTEERAAIATSSGEPGKIWEDCMVTISLCVPDLASGVAALTRLDELEKAALQLFADGITGEWNGNHYLISLQKHGVEADKQIRCHYVSIKVLFETLNVKN